MRIIKFKNLSPKDILNIKNVKLESKKSKTNGGHMVGCLIVRDNKKVFGVTLGRSRAIGSTCAERMALDQWVYKYKDSLPEKIYVIGNFNRESWSEDYITTPCGVCLEMFLEFILSMKVANLSFIFANWKLTKAMLIKLDELFPQYGKGGWPYKKGIKR